jgi:hypothetical protein
MASMLARYLCWFVEKDYFQETMNDPSGFINRQGNWPNFLMKSLHGV